MLRKVFNALVVLPLAIVLIVFALANRHFVRLSFDPFDSSDAVLSLSLPLFVVIILFTMLGVAAGGIAVWFGQRRWRRAARLHEAEARNAREQLADLRLQLQPHGEFGEAQVPAPLRNGQLTAIQGRQS
ncbi:MAG: LapA family protein [Afipia sp.]|nr:LapA family protein [Afipia sp.]